MLNKFSLLLLLFIISCSPNYKKLTWLDEYKDLNKSTREIASSDEECFIDQFEISKIKEEIPSLEKHFSKKVRLGNEYDFAEFKNAETHYIKRFSKYITLNELGKTCTDLPCVLNTAYGRKDGEEGYRIYHWFLTMGTGLSTSRSIPGFEDDPEKKLVDYLFPNQELKLLNMMSKTMPKKYQNMQVSTLHRFPDGTAPDVGTAGLYTYTWSYTSSTVTRHAGTIFFTKQNINIHQKDKKVYGYYNNVLLHEHSHALDYTYGPRNSADTISVGKKWTDMSWKWGEVTNTYIVTKPDGTEVEEERTEMEWIPDDSKDQGFVRGYQRSSPKEDFADSGAHYLISPEQLKKISPKKYEWYKNDFYSGYGTTKDDFEAERSTDISLKIKENLWEIVKSCLIDKKIETEQASKVSLEEYKYIGEKELICLEKTIENRIERELYFVKKEQYLACNYLKSKEEAIYNNILKSISPSLSEFILKIDDFKEVQKIWGIYRDELKDQCDPSHIFLKVRKLANAKESYNQELKGCIDRIHAKYTTYGELFMEEKQVYIDAHPFEKASSDTVFAYSKMMKGFKTYLSRGAEDLVDSCSTVREEELKTDGPVFGNGVFVNASVLNCINNQFSKSLDDQLFEFLEEKYTLNQEGLQYLTEQYSKQFIAFLNEELAQKNKTEYAIYQNSFIENRKVEFSFIFNSHEHLGEMFKSSSQSDYCSLNTAMLVSDKIQKVWNAQEWPLTISLNETTNQVIDKLCPELIEKAKDEHAKEFEKINTKVETFINIKLKGNHNWIDKLDNELNFHTLCTESNKSEAEDFANGVTSNNELFFINDHNLSKKTVESLCTELETQFTNQLDKIRGQSKSYSKSIIKVLEQNLDWQITTNSEEYLKSCMINAQIKVDKGFVETDKELQQFNLVPAQLISKYLATHACEQKYNIWEKGDLTKLEKIVNDKDVKSYIATLSSNSIWKEYMFKFYQSILLDLDGVIQAKFDEVYSECKSKYPYVRFAPMKLNRKKCIQVFFTTTGASEYLKIYRGDVKYHPLIENAVLKAGEFKLNTLHSNMDEYLK